MSSAKKRCPFVLSLATNWSKFRTWGIPGTVSACDVRGVKTLVAELGRNARQFITEHFFVANFKWNFEG